MEFVEFPKIACLSRPVIVTEKLDGTNASIHIEPWDDQEVSEETVRVTIDDVSYALCVGSRTRWITPTDDNYGFARWVYEHAEELVKGLGPGHHFGEWWGAGIQRKYDQKEKRFSLFNVSRWIDISRWTEGIPSRVFAEDAFPSAVEAPACCSVVPVIGISPNFDSKHILEALDTLKNLGSYAAPGFMKPEGIVVYHTAANTFFKKTFEKDDERKGR